MGNGMGTSFWKDKWLSEGVLRDLFPRLFVIWNKKNIRVGELWNSRDDVRSWTLTQGSLCVGKGGSSNFVEGVFSVNSGYKMPEGLCSFNSDWFLPELFKYEGAYEVFELYNPKQIRSTPYTLGVLDFTI